MSVRRGVGDSALSLFSFQDVITGITGVMILVSLLLVLEVTSRKLKEMPPIELESPVVEEEMQIGELERERAALAAEAERKQGIIDALPDADRPELELQIGNEEVIQAHLTARLEQAKRKLNAAQEKDKRAGQEKARSEGEIKKSETRIRELEEQIQKAEQENRLQFVFAETTKIPVIVECSAAAMRVHVMAATPETKDFPSPHKTDFKAAMVALKEWAKGRSRERDAFVVVIKPSAVAYASFVVELLANLGFDVGFEPLEEDRTVHMGP